MITMLCAVVVLHCIPEVQGGIFIPYPVFLSGITSTNETLTGLVRINASGPANAEPVLKWLDIDNVNTSILSGGQDMLWLGYTNGSGLFMDMAMMDGGGMNFVSRVADPAQLPNNKFTFDLAAFGGLTTTTFLTVSTNGATSTRFNGSGIGLTGIPTTAISGGFTTNLPVLIPNSRTNILQFNNGVLTGVVSQ